MSVEAIRLRNFMAFEDTGWIELKPISLLFGRNSHGKSAIIRALLLLRQSMHASDETGQPLVLHTRRGVDQESFKITVHKQEVDRSMVFGFRCTLENDPILDELGDRLGHEPEGPEDARRWIEVSLAFSWDSERKEIFPSAIRLESPWATVAHNERSTIFALELLEQSTASRVDEGWWSWSDMVASAEADWPLLRLSTSEHGFWPTIKNIGGFTNHPSERDFEFLLKMLKKVQDKVEEFLRAIKYLGPLRPQPERVYAMNKLAVLEWQQRGLGAFVDFLRGNLDEPFYSQLDKWLQHQDLGYEVNPPPPNEISDLAILGQVTFREVKEGQLFNLKDIGFGTSQVLPVLLQSLLAREGSLVIIEQPELHLHPSAQANLADVFAARIYDPKNEHKKSTVEKLEYSHVRFLIETHSEHLLLRLRRRIAETSSRKGKTQENARYLDTEPLQVYFVNRDSKNAVSSVAPIVIGEFGEIENEPKGFQGFFADDLKETIALNRARLITD